MRYVITEQGDVFVGAKDVIRACAKALEGKDSLGGEYPPGTDNFAAFLQQRVESLVGAVRPTERTVTKSEVLHSDNLVIKERRRVVAQERKPS